MKHYVCQFVSNHRPVKRRILSALALIIAVVVPFAAGCRPAAEPLRVQLTGVHPTEEGIAIEFNVPVDLKRVRVLETDGSLLQEILVASRRRTFEVPFEWEPGQRYRVDLETGVETYRESFTSPDYREALVAELEIPFGQEAIQVGGADSASLLVPFSGQVAVGVTVRSVRQTPTRYELELQASPGVRLTSEEPGLVEDNAIAIQGELSLEFDYRQVVATVEVVDKSVKPHLQCRFRQWPAEGEEHTQQLEVTLVPVRAAELSDFIDAGSVRFPADPLGNRQPERLADTVVLPDPIWSRVRRVLQPSSVLFDFYAAYAMQAVPLTNHGVAPVNLLIESEVSAANGDAPLLDFAPPVWKSPRESATSAHLLRLAPGETAAALIPLYVRPSVQPGSYERRFRVYLVGSQEPALEITAPLEVVRGNWITSAVVLVSLAVSVFAWIAFFTWGRTTLGRFGTEALATIGLVSGLHFVVSYVSRIGGNILAGVTGPFYIFIAGLGNEVLPSLLLAVLIVLVPRPGTWTLSSLAVFLLNAMFTGQIGVVDVLFVTVSIVLGETLLALFGVTTSGTLRRPSPKASIRAVLSLTLAIGAANAMTLYAQFCLIQVLHRLFFAAWYVAAVSLFTGFVYGAVGAACGTLLGYQLRRTVR